MAGRAAEAIWYPDERSELSAEDERFAGALARSLYGNDLSDAEVSAQIETWQTIAAQIIYEVRPGVLALAKMLAVRLEADGEAELSGAEAMQMMDAAS
jgi:hypothetical protein